MVCFSVFPQILHGDERLSVRFSDVVNRANDRMVQCGRSLSFALEPSQGVNVFGYSIR